MYYIPILRDRDRVWWLNCGAVQAKDLFRVLHVVNSLNVKHDLWFKSKAILHHEDISEWQFFVWQLKIVFSFLILHKLKQRLINSDIAERSMQLKGMSKIHAA